MPEASNFTTSNAGTEGYTYHHRVTYADCTVGNHVYYARYLRLLEAARGELIRQTGWSLQAWQEKGFIFPVIECRLQYHHPSRYDDLLAIEVWLTEAGRMRLDFTYRIINQAGQLVLTAETRHVCAGLDEKPRRAPAELAQSLARFLRP